jgi:hypothetical protein
MPAPLQNRVDPFGDIHATPQRGLFFGNRGGRFHSADKILSRRRWASKQWIICVCEFKGRKKEVFGARYTDLFFMDEPTALAAGHRPCFECRRAAALGFARAIDPARPPRAAEMDAVLHNERLEGGRKRAHRLPLDALPDGAMFAQAGAAIAVRGDALLLWSFDGYRVRTKRPQGLLVDCLTPPLTLRALRNGYRPQWAQ